MNIDKHEEQEEIIVEIFEHIKDENGNKTRYIISDYGNCENSITGKTVKPIVDHTGRKSLSLWLTKEKKTTRRIPRYIFNAFGIEPDSPDKTHIDHVDGDRTNDYIENLEWVTPSENMRRSYETGAHSRDRSGSITEEQAYEVCELLECYFTVEQVSKITRVNRTIVSSIRSGGSWKHVSGEFKFPKGKRPPIKFKL